MPNYLVHIVQKREASVIIQAESEDALEEALTSGGALGLLLDDLTIHTMHVQRETTGAVEAPTEDEADAYVNDAGEFTVGTKETQAC